MLTTNHFLTIDCGITYNEAHSENKLLPSSFKENSSHYFWPVLEAISVPLSVSSETFDHPSIFVFSSKTAIDFFRTHVFAKNKTVFKNCPCIYFVGEQSKNYFEKTFSNLSIPLHAPKQVGMQNLIDEFHLDQLDEELIFFTADNGKSRDVIESTQFKSNVLCIPLYCLMPYGTTFLNDIFPQCNDIIPQQAVTPRLDHGVDREIHPPQIIFSCRSGQVLEQAIHFLQEHFSCKTAANLPENIRFLCVGQSTLDKAKQFGIVPLVSNTKEGDRYEQ